MNENNKFDYYKALIVPINDKGQILIQDRRGHKKPDWGFFGGSIEEGETPAVAVIRESKEELGLDLKEDDLRYLGESIIYWDEVSILRHFFLYPTNQETFSVFEGKGAHWMTYDEAAEKLEENDALSEIIKLIGSK